MPNRGGGLVYQALFTLPLWLVAILLVGACLLAREVGAYVHRLEARKPDEGAADMDGYIVGAIFGLLAFLVGLTFSIALDRYDSRRALVVEEANAIATTYLRASLFDDRDRIQMQDLLRRYVDTRIMSPGGRNEDFDRQAEAGRAMRQEFWAATHKAVQPVRDTERASYFLDAVNQVFSVGVRRELAGRTHLPTRILELLILYLLISAGVLGYLTGDARRGRRFSASALIVLVSLVILVILDLDRPQSGRLIVSQHALEDLATRLDQEAGPGLSARPQAPARRR